MKRSSSMRDEEDTMKFLSTNKAPPVKRTNEKDSIPNPEHLPINEMSMNGHSDTDGFHVRTNDHNMERVAILDFGAQYGKVIDRRVRELRVQSEMFPLTTTAKQLLDLGGFKAIIISGGPKSVYEPGSPQVDPEIFTCGLPVLGICYGFQLMNKLNGGTVTREPFREDGQCFISVNNMSPLFKGLDSNEQVLLTHGDSVSMNTVAPGFEVIADSGNHVAGICNIERKLYGVQFHPEVELTKNGTKMFKNFLFEIAGCSGNFSMRSREETCIQEIKNIVGDKKVLVMVSGGVDSTVCAALLNKALGPERVTAIHIDNGFMRYNESNDVERSLANVNLPVHRFNYGKLFLSSTENQRKDGEEITLDAATEPELKRKIIGNTFIRAKDIAMKKLDLSQEDYFLAQGTLRPDLIESASQLASGHADMIKTHHNDTELVRELRRMGRVIEPLKDFHKDEVRELGKDLGLPEEIVQRHPFPGPGLAIRIICADREYRCSDFELTECSLNVVVNLPFEVDHPEYAHVHNNALRCLTQAELNLLRYQRFRIKATLLPIKTVGVQGDCRSYSYVAALSTNKTPIPWDILYFYASLIPKLFHNINRVAYVFGKEVSYPIENVTLTHLVQPNIEKLQRADKAATDVLFGRYSEFKNLPNVGHAVQQMPVVMIPIDFDRNESMPNSYKHSFVIRPFVTNDFMTGIAAIPNVHIPEATVIAMDRAIRESVLGTSRVLLDMTNKPPGTTEWE